MTRQEKAEMIEFLKDTFESHDFFYLADASTMTVEQVNEFRGLCYEKGIEMKVVKNKLAIKAMEAIQDDSRKFSDLYPYLKGPTAVLFTETANAPAKVLKNFREDNERPVLKAAYIEADIYAGDDQIKPLSELKSKEDLLAEVVALLQSPIKTVVGALQSGEHKLGGLVKALQERAEQNA
jgi:large subunit ribosomal protein L10